jgi:glycosyltransferase involved in cell wall biosynthesis
MIVHVFNSSLVSGPETLVIPALSRYKDERVVIIFLSEERLGRRSDAPPAYARSFGLEVIEIKVRSRWDKLAEGELKATLISLSPRIVHAQEVKAAFYVARAVPRDRKFRLVTTNHGVRAKKALKLRAFEWIFTHLVMPKFDRVFSVCSSDRELLIERGVPAQKVFVHLNGVDRPKVDLESRTTRSQEVRADWGLPEKGVPPDAICIGVVGRLAPEKRHAFILRAFQYLSLNAHLVVFGTGPLDQDLRALCTMLGLDGRVHWMGYRAQVGSENAGFDLLLSLSSAEGLPINLIEAGWAGTCVFATQVDGNLDLIPSSDFGVLVPLSESDKQVSEKLADLVADPAKLARKGARLQSRIEECFSEKVWISRLIELYDF